MKFYLVYKNNGLYDPVLDDYEPVYEPIDQEDFDQPSQPSEVDPFQIQQFFETKPPEDLLELRDIEMPGIPETRSLTASPFILPTKPYRPFSTEPLPEVPPLEDPIILNPNYEDQFRSSEDREAFPETKFKLPISEQYDPDGTRRKAKNTEMKSKDITTTFINTEKIVKKETFEERVKKETNISKDMQNKTMVDEMIFMEKMKKEIDLEKIEMTALNIVDESIERAVAVAGEIKEAIDIELSESIAVSEEKKYEANTSQYKKESRELTTTNKTISKVGVESEELKNNATQDITNLNETKSEVNVDQQVEMMETLNKQECIYATDSKQKEIQEITAAAGTIQRKSDALQISDSKQINKKSTVNLSDLKYVSEETMDSKTKVNKVNQSIKETTSSSKNTSTKISDSQQSSSKQRAYTIGLQTIPNIKGCIHSSYHYNLLLQTFFIHLTDVMVALSRFLLTKPVFDNEGKQTVAKETVTEHITSNNSIIVIDEKMEENSELSTVDKSNEEIIESKMKEDAVVNQTDQTKEIHSIPKAREVESLVRNDKTEEYLAREETIEVCKLSGAKMAQVVDRKSEELTQRMDAVISEFQVKAGIEDTIEIRERRSRSRSRIEEEVAHENDPLEWLAKEDSKQSVNIVETISQSSTTQSEVNQKVTVKNDEKTEKSSSKTKEGKQMYLAIVESHVFTNRDAIFEEQVTEYSETSSVQSADEINIAIKACETIATEEAMLENMDVKQELAQSAVDKSYEMVVVNEQDKSVKIDKQTQAIVEEAREQKQENIEHNLKNNNIMNEIMYTNEALNIVEEKADIKVENYTATLFDTFQEVSEEVSIREEKTEEAAHIQHNFSQSVVNESHETELAEEVEAIVEEAQEQKETAIHTITKNDVYIQDITEPVIEVQEITKFTFHDIKTADIQVEAYTTSTCENVEIAEMTNEIAIKEEKKENKAVAQKCQEVSEEISIQEEKSEEAEHIQHNFSQSVVIESYETVELAEEVEAIVEEANEQKETAIHTITKNDVYIQDITEPVIEAQEITMFTFNDIKTADIKVEAYTSISEKVERAEMTSEIAIKEEKKENKAVTFDDVSKFTSEKEIQETPKEEQPVQELSTELSIVAKPGPTLEEASAELKIVKEQILEIEQTLKLTDESETLINKHSEIMELGNQYSGFTKNTMSTYESKELLQESSFAANSLENRKKLTLDLNSAKHGKYSNQSSIVSPLSTIDTPTPSTIPPTPLTDEYVFKIKHPLPKSRGTTPVPMEVTSEEHLEERSADEDPHIVKKKLVPHIDTTLDSPIIYDTPLPSPPLEKTISPVYTKPGLRGGSDRPAYRKEEILEIERKSSLLASAIDETIKCIEEYKEEVGIKSKKTQKTVNNEHVTATDSNKDDTRLESEFIIYNGFSEAKTNGHDYSEINDEWSKIDKQLKDSNQELNALPQTVVSINHKVDNQNNKFETDMAKGTPNAIIEAGNSNKTNGSIEPNSAKEIENSSDLTNATVIDPIPNFVAKDVEIKRDPLEGYRPVQFNPEELKAIRRNLQPVHLITQAHTQRESSPNYIDASGQILGTHQGIIDGLDDPVVDTEVAKELGKPGITEEKIAELISGESEMLREAHVMGLSRVLSTHMHRPDDSSVDFKRIKPIIESLKDSEVLKALNDELIKTREEKKKEEKKWTTFLQKPKRPVPKAKFGYYGYLDQEEEIESPYKVKIVKQPKPKVAPDYKAEDFDTGPLPWEERALKEPPPPPVDAEEPILIPEDVPEFFEAVDPLPESEVPDLEETGIPLPPPKSEDEHPLEEQETAEVEDATEEQSKELIEEVVEEAEKAAEEMEQNRLAEQLLSGVQNMVDPNASMEQQLAQMRAQVAALAQLPGVIQQTLNLVTQQLSQLSQQESQTTTVATVEAKEDQERASECEEEPKTSGVTIVECTDEQPTISEDPEPPVEESKPSLTQEEIEKLRKEEEEMLEEQKRIEKQKKELMDQMRLEQESRQVKQRSTPRVGKPKPVFGPPVPQARPLVLPGGRKWRKPEDAYNEQFIAETLTAQAELIQGKTKGINFMKYEKPPVSLDHLQHSETYKLIHNMEQTPAKRVEMLTPVIAEADYREKCRSVTPASMNSHMTYPQQVYP